MHIQCSNSTYQLLKKEGFILECRGSIDIKGKGMMTTWWLIGQSDYIATPTNSTYPNKRSPSPLRPYSSTGSCEMFLLPNKQTPVTLLNGNEMFHSSNKQSSSSLRSSELLSSPKLRKSITLLNHVFNLPGSLS